MTGPWRHRHVTREELAAYHEQRKAARAAAQAGWVASHPEAHAVEQAALLANRNRLKAKALEAKAKKNPKKNPLG